MEKITDADFGSRKYLKQKKYKIHDCEKCHLPFYCDCIKQDHERKSICAKCDGFVG